MNINKKVGKNKRFIRFSRKGKKKKERKRILDWFSSGFDQIGIGKEALKMSYSHLILVNR